jgi:hypothetical protein
MSYTDALCALEYEQETAWGENVSTFATHRIPLTKPIDVGSLTQEGVDPGRNISQLQGGTTWFPGVKDGTLSTMQWLHGHGAATAGAVTLDAIETFHGFAWGNPSLAEANAAPTRSAASGTTVAAGSTTTAVNTVASGTVSRGSLVRIGTSGLSADTRGGGQFYHVNNHTGTVLTTRNALIAAPNAADVVHSAVNLYIPETVGNSQIKSWRGRVLTPANQRYILRGMYPKAIKLDGLAGGQFATIGYDWGVTSFTETSGGTWPSPVTRNDYNPSPNAGGSFIMGTVGSTVRTPYNVRDFSISVELGVMPLPGHGAVDPYSKYVSAVRTPSKITGTVTIDAEATGTNTFAGYFDAGTAFWIVASLSTVAGAALGIGLQNCKLTKRPLQTSRNGILSFALEFCAYAGTDTTTDLSQAALVIGLA